MKESVTNNKDLSDLKKSSQEVLFSCKTVFPFTLFPTRVEVTPTKVSIEYRPTPFYSRFFSVLIKDLVNVNATTNLFFGTVYFDILSFENNQERVRFLWRDDALKLKDTVMGLLTVESSKDTKPDEISSKDTKTIQQMGRQVNPDPPVL